MPCLRRKGRKTTWSTSASVQAVQRHQSTASNHVHSPVRPVPQKARSRSDTIFRWAFVAHSTADGRREVQDVGVRLRSVFHRQSGETWSITCRRVKQNVLRQGFCRRSTSVSVTDRKQHEDGSEPHAVRYSTSWLCSLPENAKTIWPIVEDVVKSPDVSTWKRALHDALHSSSGFRVLSLDGTNKIAMGLRRYETRIPRGHSETVENVVDHNIPACSPRYGVPCTGWSSTTRVLHCMLQCSVLSRVCEGQRWTRPTCQ